MANVEERLSENFYQWELRGRGWKLWNDPVFPEPPFLPFPGHFLPAIATHDDGKRTSFLGSLVKRLATSSILIIQILSPRSFTEISQQTPSR